MSRWLDGDKKAVHKQEPDAIKQLQADLAAMTGKFAAAEQERGKLK